MHLSSCSVLFNRSSADPMMSLDFADTEAGITSTVAVYKRRIDQPCRSENDAKIPAQCALNFERFRDQMATVAERLRSTIAMSNSTEGSSFYGKGFFHAGILRFRYCNGVPRGPLAACGEALWEETWTKRPRDKFPNEIKLPVKDISSLLEVDLEPRLSPEILIFLKPKKDCEPESRVDFYRVCFCCRHLPDADGERPVSNRLLCWLHPVDPQAAPVVACTLQLRRRLELAALNNYLCEFERLQTMSADLSIWLPRSERAQLFFLSVESGNWAVADWLMSGPGGCGVDALDAWGDTELARLCLLGGDPEAVAGLLSRGANKRHRDADGNSALHRLAAALRHFADPEAYVLPALRALIGESSPGELMDWLAEENSAGEKPLALLSNGAALDWIFGRLLMKPEADNYGRANEPRKSPVSPSDVLNLLTCSTGYSLTHSFAAFGQLNSAEQAVTKWLGAAAWQQLLGDTAISQHQQQQQQQHRHQQQQQQQQQQQRHHISRRLQGYSAMHAACQEGCWHNVNYLLNSSRLDHQAPPLLPESAVDLAIREGHLSSYEKFKVFVSRAMPRPDVGEALGILDRVDDCLDGVVQVENASSLVVPSVEFRLQRAASQLITGHLRDPLLSALRSAFEHDSAGSLRNLVRSRGGNFSCWGLLSSCQDVELLSRLEGTLKPTKNLATSHSLLLPFRRRPEDIGEFLGLLGLALRWGRWRLAGQLLTARQFDLLPACLAVMLCLRRWRMRQRQVGGRVLPPDGLFFSSRSSCSVDLVDGTADGGTQQPFELMDDLYKLAKRTFCGAMLRLHRGTITDSQRDLVLNYLGGRFHHRNQQGQQLLLPFRQCGPLFDAGDGARDCSIFDMMMLTKEPDLLALPCATDYVDRLMSSPRTFCCHICPGASGDRHDGAIWAEKPLRLLGNWWPEEAGRLARFLPRGWTPKSNMALTFAFNLVFACALGYYVHQIGTQGQKSVLLGLKIFLLVCAVSYAMQELRDLLATPGSGIGSLRKLCKHLSGYLAFKWNIVDLIAVCLLLFGLIAVIVLDHYDGSGEGLWYYTVRQILALSFALYCLRMLSTLSYFERLGLYIRMIKTTFVADVIPFLIVNAFFLISFGFLIVTVLFPGGSIYAGGQIYTSVQLNVTSKLSYNDYMAEMFQRPLLAHFGEFDHDSLHNCMKRPSTETECPHPLGNELYSRFLLYVYLLIVSVIFINVLIAKVSLTVSREDERARVIWRQFRAKLLIEFSGVSTPPPVLIIRWCLAIARMGRRLLRWCRGSCYNCCGATASADSTAACSTSTLSAGETNKHTNKKATAVPKPACWWLSSDLAHAPDDYKEFLWLQAIQFRKVRPSFGRHKV